MIDLRLGDCLEVMKTIKDNSIDAIITDPPYGTTACKWDSVIPFEPMWKQLNRIIKPNGAVVLFSSEPFTSALISSNYKDYKYCWYWLKNRATGVLNAKKQPLRNIENICVFNVKKYKPQGLIEVNTQSRNSIKDSDNYGRGTNKSYTQKYTGYPTQLLKFKSVQRTVHPTQKPVTLMEYLIKTYTNENETVLDFTMGSGSTMVACQNTDRNGIGIEMDENYFKVSEQRIKENQYKLYR
tara:strand:- start:55 stop:771 length:717 start_codon:yes stop_codon:yes gene_type:complete